MANRGEQGRRAVPTWVDRQASAGGRNPRPECSLADRGLFGRRQTKSAKPEARLPGLSVLTVTAIALATVAAGCAGARAERLRQPDAEPRALEAELNEVTVEVLTKDDLTRKMEKVPEKEARQVAAVSFSGTTTECTGGDTDTRTEAWIRSSIRGSFTAPGLSETMYSAQLSRCNDVPSAPKQNLLIVYLGGREVWRTIAPEAVRAVDVDGDGQDEWLELANQCNDGCSTEAWVQGYRRGTPVTVVHVERAQESDCSTMADGEHGHTKRVSVSLVRQGSKLRETRSEHVEACE